MTEPTEKFSVELWGSDPDLGNDDCWTGDEFDTGAEAMAVFNNPWPHFETTPGYYSRDTAYVTFKGPGIEGKRVNPLFKPTKDDDSDWKREQAMQAGMMGGCDAYNDIMGY